MTGYEPVGRGFESLQPYQKKDICFQQMSFFFVQEVKIDILVCGKAALPGRGAFAPYKRFGRRPKPWRRANSFRPSIGIKTGGATNGSGTQKERHAHGVSFLEREVKIDISGLRKKPPAGRSQPRAQRKRVAVGSEEQQNERAMSFVMK